VGELELILSIANKVDECNNDKSLLLLLLLLFLRIRIEELKEFSRELLEISLYVENEICDEDASFSISFSEFGSGINEGENPSEGLELELKYEDDEEVDEDEETEEDNEDKEETTDSEETKVE
jgi:hypothetical protein